MYSETFNKLEVSIAHLRKLPTFPFGLQRVHTWCHCLKEDIFPVVLIFGQTEEKYDDDLNFSIQLLQCIEAKL